MRDFSAEHAYPAAPQQLLQLWRDPEFLAAVGHKFGGVGAAVVSERGEQVVVRTQRDLPVDKMPGFVRRFVGNSRLEQTDTWPREATDGEVVEGQWQVTGSVPAKLSGTQRIVPTPQGCSVRVQGTVAVSAPLVAGKIEDLIVRELGRLIALQQAFAEQWLRGERP